MSNTDLSFDAFSARGEAVRALISDVRQERLAHALLLTGAPGTGKKALLHLIAKRLLCKAESGEKPCNVCRACKRFDARTHPDVLIPIPAPKDKNVIKVEPIRDVLSVLSRHSLEGGRRIVLLENSERITPAGQNCLLKSLEEPDDSTYFLMTADQETAILPTIRSRCRVVRVEPMTDKQVEQVLLQDGSISKDKAHLAAMLSEGSVGAARAICASEEEDTMLNLVMSSFFAVRSAKDIPAAAAKIKDIKDDWSALLTALEQQLRLCMRSQAGLSEPPPHMPELFSSAPLSGLARLLSAALETRKMRSANVSWQAAADRLLETISEEVTKWQQ